MSQRKGSGARNDDLLDDLAHGYQASQILLTANRIGLFTALGSGTKDPHRLAEELSASPRGVRILCDALVALGLLETTPDGYRNGDEVRRHLLPDSPEPRIDMLHHAARQYERWAGLPDAVVGGAPVDDERIDPRLRNDATAFARAMADVGRRSAVATADLLDLSGARRLLDIGGGPGIYAIEFARRWPRLEVTILDRAETLEVARHNVRAHGLVDRIRLEPGDAFADPLSGPYDAIFTSNLMHIYSAADNEKLVARSAGALTPGGRLILKDFFLDADRQRPPGGAIFAVNMLVSTEAGDCYTLSEARRWIESAGLDLVETSEVASKSRLLIARKP